MEDFKNKATEVFNNLKEKTMPYVDKAVKKVNEIIENIKNKK